MNKQTGWAIYLCAKTEKSLVAQRQLIQRNLLNVTDLPLITEFVDRNPNRSNFQELLEAARLGLFSHVAVSNPEALGTNESEALRMIDEFIQMGIVVRFANLPEINPIDADDRVLITLTFVLVRRESELISQRVRRGLQNKRNASNKKEDGNG